MGGFDGITGSNTVHLERRRGWRGLLIEADPNLYLKLRAHNRACWSINAAVGIKPHADTIAFYPDPQLGQLGRLGNVSHEVKGASRERVVPMFPLATLLRALNVSTVHFFSLDVEGLELQVGGRSDWRRTGGRIDGREEGWNEWKGGRVEGRAGGGTDVQTVRHRQIHRQAQTKSYIEFLNFRTYFLQTLFLASIDFMQRSPPIVTT